MKLKANKSDKLQGVVYCLYVFKLIASFKIHVRPEAKPSRIFK